jgi:hypothetical protein
MSPKFHYTSTHGPSKLKERKKERKKKNKSIREAQMHAHQMVLGFNF